MSGDFERIFIDDGTRIIIKMDVTEIRDQVEPPRIDYCDKCEMQKEITFGRYQSIFDRSADSFNIMFFCQACK